MKSWVFTTQAIAMWVAGTYACARPRRARLILTVVFPAAVLLPLVVAWVSG